jgi:DNA-binding NarL/FixJ family response regulator
MRHAVLASSAATAEHPPHRRRPVRVVLASSHPGLRTSLGAVLEGAGALVSAIESCEADTLAREVASGRADIVVLLLARERASLNTVAALARRCPTATIVAVGTDTTTRFAAKVRDAGAAEYVPVDVAEDALPAVVDAARRSHGRGPRLAVVGDGR